MTNFALKLAKVIIMDMSFGRRYVLLFITFSIVSISAIAQRNTGMISGKVLSLDGEAIDYATVFLKGTSYSCSTNEKDSII